MDGYDILLVGEGSHLFLTLAWALGYKGYRIKSAAKPEAALDALVKRNFDLVIARLAQEDKDILGVLQRAKMLNPAVKVMVVNGQHQAFPRGAYEMDLDDYLMMPVTPAELCRRVRRCLGREAPEKFQDRTPAMQINDGVRRTLKNVFWDIRSSITAALGNMRLSGESGEMDPVAVNKIREAGRHLTGIVDLSEEFLTGILGHIPQTEEPEILDLANLAEPAGEKASPKVRPRTRQAIKKTGAGKRELFEMPDPKLACQLCTNPKEYGIESQVTRPLIYP